MFEDFNHDVSMPTLASQIDARNSRPTEDPRCVATQKRLLLEEG